MQPARARTDPGGIVGTPADEWAPLRRMPVVFGPTPGPRQRPDGSPRASAATTERAAVTFVVEAVEEELDALLPAGVHRDGAARISITFASLTGVEWLAGRGYDLAEVSTPVRADALDGGAADFALVVFENLADPIISGREELGWSKVYAELDTVDVHAASLTLRASWDGFTFLEGRTGGLRAVEPPAAGGRPKLHLKSVPATGDWGSTDARYFTLTPSEDPYRELRWYGEGVGEIDIRAGRFDDLPTLVHVTGGLARLMPGGPAPVRVRAQVTRGTKSLKDTIAL